MPVGRQCLTSPCDGGIRAPCVGSECRYDRLFFNQIHLPIMTSEDPGNDISDD